MTAIGRYRSLTECPLLADSGRSTFELIGAPLARHAGVICYNQFYMTSPFPIILPPSLTVNVIPFFKSE